MSKTLHIGLVTLYIFFTGLSFLFVLSLSGIYISWLTFFTAMTSWALFCFLSVYILGPLDLFFQGRLRKPILEEEIKLKDCFMEVLRAAGCEKSFRLRIVEVENEEAFACNNNVVAVSKALLNRLTDEELKGVLAHELGHLLNRDTTISWAFFVASRLPGIVRRIYRFGRLLIWPIAGAILILSFVLFLFKPMLLMPVIAMVLFLATSWLLDRLFQWLSLALSRLREYRQDAYAHQLGYGTGLRNALKKMAQYGREPVNAYFTLMNSTRPVIYNRIRKLETLEGMRDSF